MKTPRKVLDLFNDKCEDKGLFSVKEIHFKLQKMWQARVENGMEAIMEPMIMQPQIAGPCDEAVVEVLEKISN